MSNAFLRTALTANAIFSLTSGCALAAFGAEIATLILARSNGGAGSWVLRGLGASLIGLAILLGSLAFDRAVNLKRVLPIVISDFAWVLLSAMLVVLAPGLLTGTGRIIVIAIAAVVALMGALQWYGGRLTPDAA